jgi:hypothetical protein
MCLIPCGSDRDCPQEQLCQVGVAADYSRIQGFCFIPYSDNSTGSPCDAGCDHGICIHSPIADYCSQVCQSPDDCEEGMDCTAVSLVTGDLEGFPETNVCTF